MFSQLFGGRALLESKLASLVFCITKAPVDRYALSTLRNWIVKLAEMESISLEECRDRMVLYDPLRQDDQDKKALTALLRTVTPVGQNAFQTSLNDQDKMLLCELADECSSAISACMAASNAQGALDHWKSLEKLNGIQHPAFEQGKISANSVIFLHSLNK
jgi:vacuolar-type H+-ATPase subunit I/STV1